MMLAEEKCWWSSVESWHGRSPLAINDCRQAAALHLLNTNSLPAPTPPTPTPELTSAGCIPSPGVIPPPHPQDTKAATIIVITSLCLCPHIHCTGIILSFSSFSLTFMQRRMVCKSLLVNQKGWMPWLNLIGITMRGKISRHHQVVAVLLLWKKLWCFYYI